MDAESIANEPLDGPQSQTTPVSAQELQRIKQYAEHQLQSYMAQQEDLRRQSQTQLSVRRSLHWTLDVRKIARRIDRGIGLVLRLIMGASVGAAVILAILILVNYLQSQRVVATTR